MNPVSPRPRRRWCFPKTHRIRRRPDFLRVQRRGRRHVQKDVVAVLLYRRRGDLAPVRVGFTVSKKVGNAVVRNRVKRRLRESVRTSWDLLDELRRPADVVFIARSSAADASSERLQAQVRDAFSTFVGWTEQGSGPKSGARRRR